jgi:hypothetical protein
MQAAGELDLSQFEYVAVHAPSRLAAMTAYSAGRDRSEGLRAAVSSTKAGTSFCTLTSCATSGVGRPARSNKRRAGGLRIDRPHPMPSRTGP